MRLLSRMTAQAGTAEVVDFIRRRTSVPVKHSWQPDRGFRAAESRNRALAQAQSDYIVLIDGDMVLDPSFIADHLKIARKGRLIQGSRVILTEDKTQDILDEAICLPCPCSARE